MISVQNLKKQYGNIIAVSDLSFEVEKGEILGLLGQNGAGKTTVMKIMTGFLEPSGGTIMVGGKDVRSDRVSVQSQIGYMPENAPLYEEMLVQEYLLMMAELRGLPAEKRVQAVVRAITVTGLSDRAVQAIGTLSKGYRQRVGLAQAILHNPDVLVLDEPTNGLDPVQILEIRALIKDLAKTTTVIVSTHILSEIEAVCNRVVVLIDGELAADATLTELLSAQEVDITFTDTLPSDVVSSLCEIDAITSDSIALDKENMRVKIHCTQASKVAREAMRIVRKKGWDLQALAPMTPSLENVFRSLMYAHAERKADGGTAV